MFQFKKLTHEDFEDILDISKGIWGGNDYLPKVFHKWVDNKGYFLGIVDVEKNKVIGVAKFSVLSDHSGWLEGLRVHKDYRGQKIGRKLSENMLGIAKEELAKGNVNKIAFSSHTSNKESVTLMGKLGFEVKQTELLITKEYKDMNKDILLSHFKVEPWELSYEEFKDLTYFKRRENLIPLAFVFQEPTAELFEELKKDGGFVKINGFKGIMKFKGEVNFISIEESFEAIDSFMNYYLLKYEEEGINDTFTYVVEEDQELIEKLKENHFTSWYEWKPDYLYYVYK